MNPTEGPHSSMTEIHNGPTAAHKMPTYSDDPVVWAHWWLEATAGLPTITQAEMVTWFNAAMEAAVSKARAKDGSDEENAPPRGVYGRLELPGYRENEGWITEETRFGLQMAVVRDRAGQVTAEVSLGPACRFVHLAEPGTPEPEAERLALPPGDPWGSEGDENPEGAPF